MGAAARTPDERRARLQFIAAAVLVVILALSVRVVYVFTAKVEYPIRGDINQYVLYAWNMTHRGVFSTSLPDAEVAVPDSYRGPGYPAMLALTMELADHSDLPLRTGPNGQLVLGYVTDTWMRYALYIQVLLGTGTVLFSILLARLWLGRASTLGVGLGVALWPHLITFTGILLSETLFAFAVALSLWLLCVAERRRSARLMALAGISFGIAYLVNPVLALFPPIAAVILCIRSSRRLGIVLLLAFAVAPLGLGWRNAQIANSESMARRAEENFVIGSWPQFYTAYNTRFDNEISAQILAAEQAEQSVFLNNYAQGFEDIRTRMSLDPGYYVGWYLLKKPFLFWDWAIRIGARDIYFLDTTNSPLDRYPVLRGVESTAHMLNTALFALAIVAVVIVLAGRMRGARGTGSPLPVMPAVLFVYVTAIHVVLQAEPRYSIPFRVVEILLAFFAAAEISAFAVHFGRRGRVSGRATIPRPSGSDESTTPPPFSP
ncbi:MAG: hypothetical protein P4L92_00255 [Rudaea sp.]|nr:hypothetical protein [Rudaea sp.]